MDAGAEAGDSGGGEEVCDDGRPWRAAMVLHRACCFGGDAKPLMLSAAALPQQSTFVPLCLPGPVSTDSCERTQPGIIEIELATGHRQSRSRKSAQGDKWSFCLTAGTLWPANQERP
jgi:hypothetical protein